ncbi:MAG: L-threonylcarbamoyladenylate synthase [Candidatus Roizmanbacteria bacterium]
MTIKKINKNNYSQVINYAAGILKEGGLVVFPSDTVYGLLVDATNEQAVKKLIDFKNRSAGKAISVFASDFKMVADLVDINKEQQKTIKEILPGPYTVILKSKNSVSLLLESEKGTLGIRIPMYRYIEALIKKFRKPLTATSANLASRSPHYSIKTLLVELPEKQKQLVDLIVDAGKLPRNKPSTVIDLTEPEIRILRKGDADFIKSKTLFSKSPNETKNISRKLFKTIKETDKPLIFIIEGELGVGKTVFVKGIGESLGIKNIVSPTFVVYYEYGNFYHFDLYQIEEKEEFKYLGIEKFLKPGNILCFEWGEKAGEIYELLKSKGKIVYVKMKYVSEKEREIIIKI